MALILLLVVLLCMFGVKTAEWVRGNHYKQEDAKRTLAALAATKDGNLPLPGDEIILRRDIESNTKQKFFDKRFECLDMIQDDLLEVFGSNWKQLFEEYPCYYGWYKTGNRGKEKEYDSFLTLPYFRNIWNIAYQIWLSKQGFIPYGKEKYSLWEEEIGGAGLGVKEKGYTGDTIIQAATSENAEAETQNKALIMKACRVIERNLREKHPGKAICLANCDPNSNSQSLRGVPMRVNDYSYVKPCLIWAHVFRRENKIPLSFPW